MRAIVGWLALLLSGVAAATSVVPKPLHEMVREADHVVVASIESVDMVDGKGRPLLDPRARTGPGLENQMRFNLRVREALFSRVGAVPPRLQVPLWTKWHYELGSMQ